MSDSCHGNQKCRPGKQGSNKHLEIGESATLNKNNLHVVSYLLYWLTLGILLDRIVGCFQHLSTNFHLVPATVHVFLSPFSPFRKPTWTFFRINYSCWVILKFNDTWTHVNLPSTPTHQRLSPNLFGSILNHGNLRYPPKATPPKK